MPREDVIMDKDLYIFDLDGTLLYTLDDIKDSLNDTIIKFGYNAVDSEQTRLFIGSGAKNLIKRATGLQDGEELDKILSIYIEKQRNCTNDKTILYDGLDEVLFELKKNGKKLAIISNKPDSVTQKVYDKLLSRYHFDYVYGNKPKLFKIKPNRECIDYCLNNLGVDRGRAVYIGDSEVDVQTANNAEMDCVCVLWGYRKREDMEKEGGKVFVSTPKELLKILL